MSKRKRGFDIDMPDDMPDAGPSQRAVAEDKTFPAGKVSKRGPMAAAIQDNAKMLREREKIEEQIRLENDALAHEHISLRQQGLMLQRIPLDEVKTVKLMRDRSQKVDLNIEELMTSIRDVGLSNPIQVEETAGAGYELIQGFRRLEAYKALLKETGDAETWGTIPAAIMMDDQSLQTLYRRMVDENLVRKDISFAEMAVLAIEYARDALIEETDPNKAVAELYNSVSYQKRSYIRGFIKLMTPLMGVLEYPHEIPRKLGLSLAARIEADAEVATFIANDLAGWTNRSVQDELGVLRRYAGATDEELAYAGPPKTFPAGKVSTSTQTKAKTTFEVRRPEGKAKCMAGAGRLEIKLDRDFSTIDRRRLEQAVQSLLDQLG